jgi:hypothetical protein
MPWIVYETTNLLNGKKYRGVHKQDGEEFDGYLGSGDLLILSIEKHGRQNFSRKTMFVFEDESEAYKCEAVVVDKAWCERRDTYNIKPGGTGGLPWHDPEFRAAQSDRMKASRARPEFLAAQSASLKAAHASPEFRAAQSARMKAQNASPEFRAAQSASRKAMYADPEYRAAQSASRRAMYADPEHRAAQSARMKAVCADPDWRAAHPARIKAGWVRRRLSKANTMLVIID